ncbi:xanthine dehydrogenase accessory factor [Pantoea sp. PNA 14-12]|uniref:XshC-Cox1 family protein n=1 Tax=Pantoea stewartii TaxID=66269 RepID=A0AB34VE72_9GAMM|nr:MULTISPECIES: XdhC family protein [Pantoea]KHE01204.1 XshC-Cox1 family protein [Pantoea stewartii]KHN63499.1 XshC-Cox1 family protein [Pantoea stewartii]KTS73622.1 XshC-Cox1 family protein [Pantoea stewartii]KTS96578.1 XshC-Cox1 family protein [Pantoea stewartii]KTT06284.1 XshC-Cox1 family protein [Pantoea stewartii]
MMTLDQRVIETALGWHHAGRAVWLCTVLQTWGSSPRAPGTMMVISDSGEGCGSLSGGCIEEDFLARLAEGHYRIHSQVVRYGEGGRQTQVQLPCGGSLDVLVEYLVADNDSGQMLQAMHQALRGKTRLLKTVTVSKRATWQTMAMTAALPVLRYQHPEVVLPVGAVPELLVAGYSTVAFECIRLAQILGFHVRVCEHRSEMLSELEGHFTGQDTITIVPQHPARWLELNGAHAAVAIVSLTHDPRIDELTMMEAVNTHAFYIGIMGSAKNTARRKTRLQTIAGLDNDELARIIAPVGLAIGSKTPAEIALSVMADIVRVKNHC